jgi:hypothetical protein
MREDKPIQFCLFAVVESSKLIDGVKNFVESAEDRYEPEIDKGCEYKHEAAKECQAHGTLHLYSGARNAGASLTVAPG